MAGHEDGERIGSVGTGYSTHGCCIAQATGFFGIRDGGAIGHLGETLPHAMLEGVPIGMSSGTLNVVRLPQKYSSSWAHA